MTTYIQLERQFEHLPESDSDEDLDRGWRLDSQTLSWASLRTFRFVVVLGEAGVGKTVEMQEQALMLRVNGSRAVFVRLDDLVNECFEKALSDEDATAFAAWSPDTEEATFFLDAIDEAKLNGAGAFNRALREFVRAADRRGGNVRVIMSCRPSDWQYRTDIGTICSVLRPLVRATGAVPGVTDQITAYDPAASAEQSGNSVRRADGQDIPVEVLRLRPLDARQIKLMAEAYDITNVDSFMAALRSEDGLFLAERPRDLEWLANYWNREERLGTQWEMLAENISAKLKERNPIHSRIDPLPPERALRAAENLAAAAVMCRQPALRIPDPEIVVTDPRPALDAGQVLEDWQPVEVAALLRRPLFDEAPAGRVRFHHRTTRAYLAARWMLRLLAAGCPVPTLLDLLLGSIHGRTYPIASMIEVAGWITCKDASVRHKFMDIRPDIVLLMGDAAQIPIEDRVRLLRRLGSIFAGDARLDWIVTDSDYARIADPGLDDITNELLENPSTSVGIRRFLLHLTRIGRFPKSAATAFAIATEHDADASLRHAAVLAIGAVGSRDQLQALREFAFRTDNLNNGFLADIGHSLFPSAINIDDLAVLLNKFHPEDPDIGDGSRFTVTHQWVDRCEIIDLQPFLAKLLELATSAPLALRHGYTPILSQRLGWLIEAMLRTTMRIVNLSSTNEPSDVVLRSLLLIQSASHDQDTYLHGLNDLKKIISATPTVRHAFIRAHLLTTFGSQTDFDAFIPINKLIYQMNINDIDWLISDAKREATQMARCALLRGAVEIWMTLGGPEGHLPHLKRAVVSANLTPTLTAHLIKWLRPRRAIRPQTDTYDIARRKQAAAILADARKKLEDQLNEIKSGKAFPALYYLVSQLIQVPSATHTRWGQTNIHEIEKLFGPKIANAARQGLDLTWRRWVPPLPSEHGARQAVENGVIVGLTALAIAEISGFDFGTMADQDAVTATHYALREMNSFPSWFEALAAGKPAIIGPILLGEVIAGLKVEPGPSYSTLLSSIRHSKPAITVLADPIVAALETSDISRHQYLAEVLGIVRAADKYCSPRLTKLASTHARALWSTDINAALVWFQAWLSQDSATAWPYFESQVASASEAAKEIVSGLLLLLRDDLSSQDRTTSSYLRSPDLLARMLPVIQRIFSPTDDFQHADAQAGEVREARNRILELLQEIPGTEAHTALHTLAQHDDLIELRPAFRRAIERHAVKAIEPPAWAPSDIARFAVDYEKEPATPADLFRLVCNRLTAIKYDIEQGDFGDRGIFHDKVPEETLQRYFAGRLDRASRGRYAVTREEEVANQKEPDIRVRHARAGVVSIEIKPIDSTRYSIDALKDTLARQLVGQYMRAANSNCGILLLCMVHQRQWRLSNQKHYGNFGEAIEILRADAKRLIESHADIHGLTIIGIDATSWNKISELAQ